MSKSNSTVLVVGAPGRFAGHVVPALARRGVTVRGLARNEAEAAAARNNGAHEIAYGDLRDPKSLDAAVKGADGVFHIGPVFERDEGTMGVNMVDAARRAKIRAFVFSSVIQLSNTTLEHHAAKVPVETALYVSDMQFTILHPTNFFQNIGGAWNSVVETGVFAEPFPKTARIARVDFRDVAEVAAIALTEDRLAYGTFELCADGMPNREEIVAIMSSVLGKRITAGEPSFEAWAAAAKLPFDTAQLALLAQLYKHYAAHGAPGNSLTLRAILGREPRTLRSYIEELAGHVPARRSVMR